MRSLCLMSRGRFLKRIIKKRIIEKENNRKREYEEKRIRDEENARLRECEITRIRDEENRIKLEFAFTIGSAVF